MRREALQGGCGWGGGLDGHRLWRRLGPRHVGGCLSSELSLGRKGPILGEILFWQYKVSCSLWRWCWQPHQKVACILGDFGLPVCPDNRPGIGADYKLDVGLRELPYHLAQANPGTPVGFFQEAMPSRWTPVSDFLIQIVYIECTYVDGLSLRECTSRATSYQEHSP